MRKTACEREDCACSVDVPTLLRISKKKREEKNRFKRFVLFRIFGSVSLVSFPHRRCAPLGERGVADCVEVRHGAHDRVPQRRRARLSFLLQVRATRFQVGGNPGRLFLFRSGLFFLQERLLMIYIRVFPLFLLLSSHKRHMARGCFAATVPRSPPCTRSNPLNLSPSSARCD